MPRGSSIPFAERAHILKSEVEEALRDPEAFAARLEAAHGAGPPQPLQVRIMGPAREALRLAQEFIEQHGPFASVGVSKLEKDKKNRVGDYSGTNIRVYLNKEPTGDESPRAAVAPGSLTMREP